MRFLVSVLLLAMFSSSAIAKEEDRWLYLDCLDVMHSGSNTFTIDMTGKTNVETNVETLTIKKISKKLINNIHELDFVYNAIGRSKILFEGSIDGFVVNGKKHDNYQIYFIINRINGVMTVYHRDERENHLKGKRYSDGECSKKGRRF